LGKSPQVLVGQPVMARQKASPRPAVGGLALTAGVFIVLLGWVDILVGWFPVGFGSAEWEFGAVSATVDGLPFSTLGLAALLLGALASGSRRGLWLAAVWTAWVLVVLLAGAVLYGLTVPVALGALGPAGLQDPLGRAVIKTSSLLVIYLCFYCWMGLQAIRALKGKS
jgi:hypothetical protein